MLEHQSGPITTTSLKYGLLDKTLRKIRSYFHIDPSLAKDVKVSNGNIIFKYKDELYICPVSGYQDGEIRHGKISDIILEYYPDIIIAQMQDIQIIGMMIAFSFHGEKHLCPLTPKRVLKENTENARIREEELYRQQERVRGKVGEVILTRIK